MILVDTSVLVSFLRTRDTRLGGLLQSLPTAICGAIRTEILAGSRTPNDRSRLITFLAAFRHIDTPEPIWDAVGDTISRLGSQALTVPFSDALIATLAIANDVELWHHDRHFVDIQRVISALRLFQEPP